MTPGLQPLIVEATPADRGVIHRPIFLPHRLYGGAISVAAAATPIAHSALPLVLVATVGLLVLSASVLANLLWR